MSPTSRSVPTPSDRSLHPAASSIDGADLTTALVLAVARLGETGLRGWWRSHGLGQAGRYVLGGAFPRTWRSTALELDLLSAARLHDTVLARPGAVHVFSDRLPFRRTAAGWLAELKTAPAHPLIDRIESWDLAAAERDLREWAGPPGQVEPLGQGLLVGEVSSVDLESPDSLIELARRLASMYVDLGPDFRASEWTPLLVSDHTQSEETK